MSSQWVIIAGGINSKCSGNDNHQLLAVTIPVFNFPVGPVNSREQVYKHPVLTRKTTLLHSTQSLLFSKRICGKDVCGRVVLASLKYQPTQPHVAPALGCSKVKNECRIHTEDPVDPKLR